jgi:8-oxo-dGTP diphosphatase
MPRRYSYCPHCATLLVDRLLHGQLRQVCPACEFIFWQNPAVGVAVIVMDEARVVLGRRSRGVYQGAWCIPCGYVEYDEDVRLAAQREFKKRPVCWSRWAGFTLSIRIFIIRPCTPWGFGFGGR